MSGKRKLLNRLEPDVDTIDCPSCGYEHEPDAEDHGSFDMVCEGCEFVFHVETEYTVSYSTTCKEHDYGEEVHQYGNDYYQKCNRCYAVKLIDQPLEAQWESQCS